MLDIIKDYKVIYKGHEYIYRKITDPGAWGHEGTIQLIKDGIEVEMNGDSLREFRDAIKANKDDKSKM